MIPKVVRPDDEKRIRLHDVLSRYGIGSGESDGSLSILQGRSSTTGRMS
jgi:hypothetical protein